ncbi:MAG: glycine betaine ABC transporter substrate-binding protein [Armatimonadota bacterium]|nr:glycine betaine ABC transporter substrate-binding protein [Armatimonadota bacterium]
MVKRAVHVLVPLLVVTLAAACGPRSGGQVTLKVGSKDFTEEFILGEMYALLLEDAGFKVERKLNLGGTPIAHEALLKGDIDLYPEYTSTGLLTVLKQQPIADARAVLEAVRKAYSEQFKLEWLEPAAFNNTQALATTKEVSETFGVTTYSELAAKAPELRLGGPAEFAEREDGIKGLQKAYGGFQFKEFIQLGTGSLRYEALKNRQVDVVVAFGTDGQISGLGLVLLKDDKGFYPVYQAAPVVRADVLEKHPRIAEALNKLAPLLTDEVMAGLNWQVDGPDKKEFAAVAKAFLQEKGLIKR